MKRNLILLYCSLLLVPIVINYGLLSWTAPGVSTNENPWLGFLGSFLGFIGAISIALINNSNQKKRDYEQEKKNNRSYIILHDFTGPIGLKTINTHENSRLINTNGYQELQKKIPKDEFKYISTSFLKISQHGNSEIILNCNISISYEKEDGTKLPDINVNTGILEKDIELFIPLIPTNTNDGKVVNLKKVNIEYTTLMNERMRYVSDYDLLKEYHIVLDENGNENVLFEFDFEGSQWAYPNKSKSNDL